MVTVRLTTVNYRASLDHREDSDLLSNLIAAESNRTKLPVGHAVTLSASTDIGLVRLLRGDK
jgi:hypothetical protein